MIQIEEELLMGLIMEMDNAINENETSLINEWYIGRRSGYHYILDNFSV